MTHVAEKTAAIDRFETRLRSRGSRLLKYPTPADRPAFLAGFQPDALVEGPEGNFVIEVVRKGDRDDRHRLARLQNLIAAQNEWRLQVLYAGMATEQPGPASLDRLAETVATIRHLGAEHPGAALLLAWSALEGAARQLEPEKARNALFGSALVELLASEGYILPDDATQLRRIETLRHRIAHGDLSVVVSSADIAFMADMIEGLL